MSSDWFKVFMMDTSKDRAEQAIKFGAEKTPPGDTKVDLVVEVKKLCV